MYNLCEQLGYKCFFIKETNSAALDAFKQVRSSHEVVRAMFGTSFRFAICIAIICRSLSFARKISLEVSQ